MGDIGRTIKRRDKEKLFPDDPREVPLEPDVAPAEEPVPEEAPVPEEVPA